MDTPKYVVVRQFRKREIASGMVEGGAEAPVKETIREEVHFFREKRKAESFFSPKNTPQMGNAVDGEIHRLLCSVTKSF
jgi:hypothetical protein